jgi:hypothetical protein
MFTCSSLQLIAAGDAAHNGVHLHLSESPIDNSANSGSPLQHNESLKPRIVVAGYKNGEEG